MEQHPFGAFTGRKPEARLQCSDQVVVLRRSPSLAFERPRNGHRLLLTPSRSICIHSNMEYRQQDATDSYDRQRPAWVACPPHRMVDVGPDQAAAPQHALLLAACR